MLTHKELKRILDHNQDEEKQLKLKLSQLEFSTDTLMKDYYSIKLHRVMESIDMATNLMQAMKPDCCSKCKRPF